MSWSRSSVNTWPGFLRKKRGPNPLRPRPPKPPSAPLPRNGRGERTATRVKAMTAKLNQAHFCIADMAFLPDAGGESRLNPPEGNVKYTLHFVECRLPDDPQAGAAESASRVIRPVDFSPFRGLHPC